MHTVSMRLFVPTHTCLGKTTSSPCINSMLGVPSPHASMFPGSSAPLWLPWGDSALHMAQVFTFFGVFTRLLLVWLKRLSASTTSEYSESVNLSHLSSLSICANQHQWSRVSFIHWGADPLLQTFPGSQLPWGQNSRLVLYPSEWLHSNISKYL